MAALAAVRQQAGLSLRELARRVATPHSTVGDYFSGRHVPSNAQLPLVRDILGQCGVDDPDEIEQWIAAVHRVRSASDRRVTRGAAPYRGLASFEEGDAELFFGREAQTRDILERITRADAAGARVLVVIGPSGSGKSSVLRAGVAAAVRRGDLDTGPDERWTCVLTTPNAPLPAPADAPDRPGRTLLVVDQFEQVFTSLDASARAAYLQQVATHAPGRVVVLGMRADFFSEAAREPTLLPALQHGQVVIGPMGPSELREAIVRPAQRMGSDVDDALVELVLADLAPPAGRPADGHDAGALPLMSHALLSTWEQSSGRTLTVNDYRATGGIDGAVQHTAEDVYAELSETERTVARAVFLRLVHLDGEVLSTRRRISASELDQLGTPDGRVNAADVAGRFVRQRLVTAGDAWFEISHEALLSAWPRLRGWVDEDRSGQQTHRWVTIAANAWAAAGQDPGLLLRAARLDLAHNWADTGMHRRSMNDLEHRFLSASMVQREVERMVESRRARRLRQLFVAVAVLAIVGISLSVVSLHARMAAQRAQAEEQRVRDDALSRAAAFESRELSSADPALAQQLAVAAYRVSPSAQARAALLDASADPVITRILGVPGPTPLAVSADGALIAVGRSDDGSVRLYATDPNGAPPLRVATLRSTDRTQLFALAFTPDGDTLVTGGDGRSLTVWDVREPTRPVRLASLTTGFTGAVQSLAVAPDGHTLAVGGTGPDPLLRYDLDNPARPVLLGATNGQLDGLTVQGVAWSGNGSQLAAGTSLGHVFVWSSATVSTRAPRTMSDTDTTIDTVRFDPVRPLLYAGDRYGVVSVWRTEGAAQTPVTRLRGSTNSQVNAIGVSADGHDVAAGSSDDTLRQWNTTTWRSDLVVNNPGPVTGVAYGADGSVITTAADGALRLQQAQDQRLPASGTVFALVWSSNDSRLLVATNGDNGGLQLWNALDPARPQRLGGLIRMPTPYHPVAGSGAMRSDGKLVAAGNDQGRVEIWDTSDPTRARATVAPFDADGGKLVESLAWSPDGRDLAVGGDDGVVHLWDVSDPAHPRQVSSVHPQGLVLGVAFSPDGRHLLAGDSDDNAYLYDVTDPARPVTLAHLGGFRSYIYGVAFSPDGRTAAVTSADDTSRLYDISAPRHPRRLGSALVGPTDYVYAASFRPNGRTVAIGSNDRTVRLYDARGDSRIPKETLATNLGGIFAVAYSNNGAVLAGGGRSDDVTLWTTGVGNYAREVCRLAGDPITRQEWQLYVPDQPYEPPCR